MKAVLDVIPSRLPRPGSAGGRQNYTFATEDTRQTKGRQAEERE